METYDNNLAQFILILMDKLFSLWSVLDDLECLLRQRNGSLMRVHILILPCHLPHNNTLIQQRPSHVNTINIPILLDRNSLINTSQRLLILPIFPIIPSFGIIQQ